MNGVNTGYPPSSLLADIDDFTDNATILGILRLSAMDRISLLYGNSTPDSLYPFGQTKVDIQKVN